MKVISFVAGHQAVDRIKLVQSRAHRTLRHLSRYQSLVGLETVEVDSAISQQLQPDELLVGIYRNSDSDMRQNIVFSTLGVYVFQDGWRLIRYDEIERVYVPLPSGGKRAADTITLYLPSDAKLNLYVLGGTETTREIWEVVRFLNRVIAGVKQNPR